MRIRGKSFQTIWIKAKNKSVVQIIDQRFLPHRFVIEDIKSCAAMTRAIQDMHVRGAPLLGVAGAYGIYLAALESRNKRRAGDYIENAALSLLKTRPTAVNLERAVSAQLQTLQHAQTGEDRVELALAVAEQIKSAEIAMCEAIGAHGLRIMQKICRDKKRQVVNVMTHCNAGWLACVDWGTATAPIYRAALEGIKLHVWVSETRPRNQGSALTAFELAEQGIPHTVIPDNAAGHLMQRGLVDLVIVGSDRVTRRGDAANKIGTYLKALAAADNNVPFFVAIPSSSIDAEIEDGRKEIVIEERSPDEVRCISGLRRGKIETVLLTPRQSPARNFGFDVTPAHLISGFITERGVCAASLKGLLALFPEMK